VKFTLIGGTNSPGIFFKKGEAKKQEITSRDLITAYH